MHSPLSIFDKPAMEADATLSAVLADAARRICDHRVLLGFRAKQTDDDEFTAFLLQDPALYHLCEAYRGLTRAGVWTSEKRTGTG